MTNANVVVDIRALAQLGRLEISDAEVQKLENEIPGILEFVRSIQAVHTIHANSTPMLYNVTRQDADAHETGTHTESLLSGAPAREGDKIAVKQVISRK